MSLFSWLSPKKRTKAPAAPQSSGLSRMDSTRPYQPSRQQAPTPNAQPANRKSERMARRELLYNVVREGMVRAGVLSSSYKFKVLSLDSRGRQFLVMVDLAQGAAGDTARLAEIEAAVAQMAKQRFDILVTAVYWRSNEHVAVGDPLARPHVVVPHAASPSRPMPLEATPPRPVPLPPHVPVASTTDHVMLPDIAVGESLSQPAELQAAPQRGADRFEPLLPDEVAAFKRALAVASAPVTHVAPVATQARTAPMPVPVHEAPVPHVHASARAFNGDAKSGPQSYTLLTGFEDTELPEEHASAAAGLSATQYGELR